MDPFTAITAGLSITQGTVNLFKDIKSAFAKGTPEEAIDAINKAEQKVSELLGNQISVQQLILETQNENEALRKQLAEMEDWEQRKANYKLITTSGGAVVYQHDGDTQHYACPVCFENKEIQILQDRRVMTGHFDCQNPTCKAKYIIKG